MINPSPPCAKCMHQWISWALVQIVAWCLFGASHYLNQCYILSIGPLRTNFSEILIKIQSFSFTKMHLNIWSAKWQPFCPRGDELVLILIYDMVCFFPIHDMITWTHFLHYWPLWAHEEWVMQNFDGSMLLTEQLVEQTVKLLMILRLHEAHAASP